MASAFKKAVKKSKCKGRAKTNEYSHASKVAIIERRYQVMELRKQGYTVEQIAKAVGYSSQVIRGDIQEVLRVAIHETAETTEESRQLQMERLDALLKEYMPLATESHKEIRVDARSGVEQVIEMPPNPIYAQLVLSIEARRAKLLALDVPETKKIEATGIRVYEGVDLDRI